MRNAGKTPRSDFLIDFAVYNENAKMPKIDKNAQFIAPQKLKNY